MWDNAMNVYDFDKTIYRGDSTVDFWRHCLRRYPGAARALPGTLAKALLGPPSYWYRAVVPGTAIEYGRDYFRFAGFFDRRGLPPPRRALSRFAGGRA